MTQITHDHVEWAVVGRLRLMIETEPHPTFNVTQSYSLFTTILCWVMQRIRIQTHEVRPAAHRQGTDDRKARALFAKLDKEAAAAEPWLLPITSIERIAVLGERRLSVPPSQGFEGHSVGRVLVNLRDAVAHGDACNVVHFSREGLLIGFRFLCAEYEGRGRSKRKVWEGSITLLEADMRRIGAQLANLYCDALRRSDRHRKDGHFGNDAASIREVAA
ncbi:MAG: hypothetical protein AB7S41_02405 [Parvibaculaceae bacterium]